MKKKNKWFHGVATAALLTSVVLGGCSSSEGTAAGNTASTDGGGKKELGSIAFYSPETPDMTKEMGQAFEKLKPGSSVNVQYAGTNVLVNRMIAEKDNPMADLWYGGGGFLPFESAKDKGIITSYTPEAIKDWPEVQDGIKVRDKDWKWIGAEVFVLGFVYNTDLVKPEELPKTWDDLLDPKWKGKIQMPNPAASGTATLLVLSQLMEKGEEPGWEYFKKLVDQMSAMPDSGSAPTKAVAKGEALIGIGFDFMAYENKAKGEKVDFIVPEKTPIIVNPVSLVENGPNPDGGKAFIDYLLSKEGQQKLADWYHIPISKEVQSKTPLTLEKVIPHAQEMDVDWVVQNYDRVRNEWRQKFQ
ncbi:extracellular solute-binding protein [Brevibacillus centrosporus]|uniref:Iron(III) transport system substrate-binding protein n=1 Tax=Brevibacillus centrosporus TaxID=54910 RepID=A0A1I3QJN4_9BACL|nr:extracellular solute-binding protein [Brevibacillus centrosporus]MEC2129415.1 extracellular solute-binding protein [Brevibacillus centrosporus]MED4908839.1 extracellular solute-binding protein [Brevibacillus centrosporus]RNB65579.1 extracellular solute-binding protein [Brevibacillus centrosporus]SFJ33772.1 iron(III) transport system substrate-binding protein [Brevibacillus centrosporus]GED29766.1 putative 2-aminoethylphosphonate ABC transporter substrate-binding protein [Brevibacillus centr